MGYKNKKRGLPPGSFIHIGTKKQSDVTISIIDYNKDQFKAESINKFTDIFPYTSQNTVTWVNVDGLHDISLFHTFSQVFNIHPLLIEDILNTRHRPKVNVLQNYMVIILKMIRFDEREIELVEEQISLIVKGNNLFTFQEGEGDVLNPVRKMIQENIASIREQDAGYLAYSILDSIVDHYIAEAEKIGEQIEQLEEELIHNPTKNILQQIYLYKNVMTRLRKVVWPVREIINGLEKTNQMDINTNFYLSDVTDHIIHVMDLIEVTRSMATNLLDIYYSSVSNKMNEVMKVLTIVSTIFIPLTFVAGIYGMNFENIPELEWEYGYLFALCIMGTMTIGMLIFFKKKDWF